MDTGGVLIRMFNSWDTYDRWPIYLFLKIYVNYTG